MTTLLIDRKRDSRYLDDLERFTAYADGQKFERFDRKTDWERDHSSGSIWEWIDVRPTDDELAMLKEIAKAQQSTLRFNGQQYYSDFKVPKTQKEAVTRVLELHAALVAEAKAKELEGKSADSLERGEVQ